MSNEKTRPLVTVAALVQNRDQQLLFLKSPKWQEKWALPAGKVESGESLVEALHREVMEETGLELKHASEILVQEIIHPADFHEPAHFISHGYLAVTDSTQVTRNYESVDHCWLSMAEALNIDLNSPTRDLLEHPETTRTLNRVEQTLGKVIVDRLEFDCIIGILPEERVTPQPLRLTIELKTCFKQARATEDVKHTVDYFQLAQTAQALITERKYQLLETLVEEVAELCFEDARVSGARIRAEKPKAIPGAQCSAVEICRNRTRNPV